MSQASGHSVTGTRFSRRAFLQASVAAGGAFLLGFRVPPAGAASPSAGTLFAPNAFIRIDRQGAVTLIMPQVEMGQGVYTAVAMILAEELDVQWDQVRLEAAPPDDKLYGNPTFGIQVTGNSRRAVRERGQWPDCRMDAPHHGLVDYGALDPAGIPERHRYRRHR
jgi:isoquinoline 1-oxidoreductase beta subunit